MKCPECDKTMVRSDTVRHNISSRWGICQEHGIQLLPKGAIHLCKDLIIGHVYPIRKKYQTILHEQFENWEITVTGFLDETPPGCSCPDAKLLKSESVKRLHPSYIIDCSACSFYLSWKERMETGDIGSVYALQRQAFMELHCFGCQRYEVDCPSITAEMIEADECPVMVERKDNA